MTTTIVKTIVCDICNEPIARATSYVNANVYGKDFHILCMQHTTADIVVPMLLDDIDLYINDDENTRNGRYYGAK